MNKRYNTAFDQNMLRLKGFDTVDSGSICKEVIKREKKLQYSTLEKYPKRDWITACEFKKMGIEYTKENCVQQGYFYFMDDKEHDKMLSGLEWKLNQKKIASSPGYYYGNELTQAVSCLNVGEIFPYNWLCRKVYEYASAIEGVISISIENEQILFYINQYSIEYLASLIAKKIKEDENRIGQKEQRNNYIFNNRIYMSKHIEDYQNIYDQIY